MDPETFDELLVTAIAFTYKDIQYGLYFEIANLSPG